VLEAIFNWNTFWIFLMILYVPICFSLIGIVLLQKGKGVGFAGAFGLGAGSEAMFGPRGSVSLPVRITQVLAGSFMVLALVLSLTGGLARRGLAPDLVDAATLNGAATEATGLLQLQEQGLGSAVGGPAPEGGFTVIDESGEGEPPAVDLDVDFEVEAEDAPLPDIVLEDTPVELAPEAPAVDDEPATDDAAGEDAPEAEQPADAS
jgi:protein translocase SecG subunit